MPKKASLEDMVAAVRDAERPVTSTDIAEGAGVTRRTVANYSDELQEHPEILHDKVGKNITYWHVGMSENIDIDEVVMVDGEVADAVRQEAERFDVDPGEVARGLIQRGLEYAENDEPSVSQDTTSSTERPDPNVEPAAPEPGSTTGNEEDNAQMVNSLAAWTLDCGLLLGALLILTGSMGIIGEVGLAPSDAVAVGTTLAIGIAIPVLLAGSLAFTGALIVAVLNNVSLWAALSSSGGDRAQSLLRRRA